MQLRIKQHLSPGIQGLKVVKISSTKHQSISSSNGGYSMGGGSDVAGEDAVGATRWDEMLNNLRGR